MSPDLYARSVVASFILGLLSPSLLPTRHILQESIAVLTVPWMQPQEDSPSGETS